MPQFGAVFPLWSFSGANDSLLERLRHEVGLDYITIPVITGPVTEFRPEPHYGPHDFHTAGGWHYRPDRGAYHGTDIRPRTADWLKSRDLLPALIEAARGLGLQVLLEMDVHGAMKADPHAARLARRNLWDESVTMDGPCLMNPESQSILEGALTELLAFQPAGIVVRPWPMVRSAVGGRFHSARDIRTVGESLCYCSACAQLAHASGVDVESMRRAATVSLMQSLKAAGPRQASCGLPLKRYLVDQWLDEARQSKVAWLPYFEHVRRSVLQAWLRMSQRAEAVERFMACADPNLVEIEPPPSGWTFMRRDALMGGLTAQTTIMRWEREPAKAVRLRLCGLNEAVVPQLVQVTRAMADAATRIEFSGVHSGFEELPTWLKQAVRFASREASA